MKLRVVPWVLPTAAVCVVILLVCAIRSGPRNPVALIRVVDAAGKPVAGAVITPDGLRTKPGPYESGHYGWRKESDWPANNPVSTDRDGFARVPYPKYVFERIEAGQISFSVNHPEFVPDRPFRTVTTTPPAGAPWRVWANNLWNRIRNRALIARPAPVVLQRGAVLKLSVRHDTAAPRDALLFAQAPETLYQDTNFWIRPEAGVIVTRRLAAGPQAVRAIQFDSNGSAWFSDVIRITAVSGQTNEAVVDLKPGVAVHGRLDASVPRPVTNGRVVAHVWPQGHEPRDSPPQWHAWSRIREDGSFDIGSLPAGNLEIVALCNGFVSTNGAGQFQTRHPQKHVLGTNDIEITLSMEPTARLEVLVLDAKGNPLKDARVSTWPNVRYGEWSATLLGQDCYHTADSLRDAQGTRAQRKWWFSRSAAFQATTDVSGVAVILNLPREANGFQVGHPRFSMPAMDDGSGQKRRQASMSLRPGQTNRVSVQLEPVEVSPITHY